MSEDLIYEAHLRVFLSADEMEPVERARIAAHQYEMLGELREQWGAMLDLAIIELRKQGASHLEIANRMGTVTRARVQQRDSSAKGTEARLEDIVKHVRRAARLLAKKP